MSTWANSLNIKTSTVPVYPIKSMVTMKKPTFPFILKQAMKRSKKNALKTEVGNIQTETLDKQPGDCIQLQRIIIERYKTHGGCPKYDQSQQGKPKLLCYFSQRPSPE